MSNQKIRDLLVSLDQELARTDIDEETRALMRTLDADIIASLGADESRADHPSLIERAKRLETRFAANHPVAEQALREVMNILNRIGI